jgi:uncharacterized lipoprotein YajG
MKNLLYLVLAAALLMAGCATKPDGGSAAPDGAAPAAASQTPSLRNVPDFVNKAYQSASDNVLVGVGTYMVGKEAARMSFAKTMAETRARADISRQLQTISNQMINDYTAANEFDPSAIISFQESINQQLSKSELKGSKIMEMDTDASGLLWVVVQYDKAAAAKEYNAAANAAKLAVPAALAFDALTRMETAFSKQAGGGPVPVGD